jgi:hypothetical protein
MFSMKNKIIGLIALVSFPFWAFSRVFYVSNDGNNNSNGLSPATAWETVSKVNNFAFTAGDSILFKSGDIWREQLILQRGSGPGAYITYSSYGSGLKPQIRRSISANVSAKWINKSGNIWELDEEFPQGSDVGFISFNHDAIIGRKVWSNAELDVQGEFWCDENSNNRTRVYSDGNPAVFYNDIEVAIHENGIHGLDNLCWVIIDNLHPCYCAWSGIELPAGSHDIVIRNCDISYCGGGHQYGRPAETRNGQGINTRTNVANAEIYNCRIWQCWDGGIALQGYWNGGLTIHNVKVHHNIISHCEYGFEFWGTETNSDLQHICFENNTCLFQGHGWSYEQRPVKRGCHIMIWSLSGIATDLNIRNNVFYEGKGPAFYFHINQEPPLNLDHNCYYRMANSSMWHCGNQHDYTQSQFSQWQNNYGFDMNSIVADPLLVDAMKNDFHLQSVSPAKNAGNNSVWQGVPDIKDYDGVTITDAGGNVIAPGGTVSCGAYEYKVGATGTIDIDDGGFGKDNNGILIYPNPAKKYLW